MKARVLAAVVSRVQWLDEVAREMPVSVLKESIGGCKGHERNILLTIKAKGKGVGFSGCKRNIGVFTEGRGVGCRDCEGVGCSGSKGSERNI